MNPPSSSHVSYTILGTLPLRYHPNQRTHRYYPFWSYPLPFYSSSASASSSPLIQSCPIILGGRLYALSYCWHYCLRTIRSLISSSHLCTFCLTIKSCNLYFLLSDLDWSVKLLLQPSAQQRSTPRVILEISLFIPCNLIYRYDSLHIDYDAWPQVSLFPNIR